MIRIPPRPMRFALYTLSAMLGAHASLAQTQGRSNTLEEVIVTAQKRTETLQEAPISIAALGESQLRAQGITNLKELGAGAIPSLRIQPFIQSPSTLAIAIRGNGPTDVGQITRETSVAVYIDDVYMSRSQGLSMSVADLERIEVLRGPQGSLFGRNATGGAVHMISKKPSGEFDLRQTLTAGNYNYFESATHLNLPEFNGIRTKLDYFHSRKDGWVRNSASGENDYSDNKQDAARFALNWDITDNLNLSYAYDWSKLEATHDYLQLMFDGFRFFGAEKPATDRTRFPVRPLDPTETRQSGHAMTLSWDIRDNLTLKSISAYRKLDEEISNNYAGALYFNGLITASDIGQNQFSQEIQLLGETRQLKWIAGLYYYKEEADEYLVNLASLDIFGGITGTPMTPILPPIPQPTDVPRYVKSNSKSQAIFGHVTWTPPAAVLEDRLEITVGLRYTEDEKDGYRNYALPALVVQGLQFQPFKLDTDSLDPTITFSYQWRENLNTYIRWATAYKAAGVNMRSSSFRPYDEETVETWEVGLKSEFWQRRARMNLAVFKTEYDDFQIDFADPASPTFSETINASRTVSVDGLELELTVLPLPGLTLDLSYTYLDGHQPLQPNPLAGGALDEFQLAQTPKHSGSLSVDYEFSPLSFGTLSAHLSVIATDRYAYTPRNVDFQDSYHLINGRLTLADIPLGNDKGNLSVALWGKNLANEKYRVYSFPVGSPLISHPAVYGEPRTYGVEVEYRYR